MFIKKIFERQLELLGYAPVRINELAALQQENGQLRQEKEIVRKKCEVLGSENESLLRERNNLSLQLDEFKEIHVKQWNEKLTILQQENEQLRQERAKVNKKCEVLEGEKESLLQEKNSLSLQLDEFKEIHVKQWNEKLTILQQENEQLRQKNEILHKECEVLGCEKESLLQEKNGLCQQLDELKEIQAKEWHEKFNFLLRTQEEAAVFVNIFAQGVLRKYHRSVSWGDRLLTLDKTAGFWEDQKFFNACKQIKESQTYDQYSGPDGIAWRLNTLVWAAKCACALPGDFVECGVFKGDMSWVVANVMDWDRVDKIFYLYDTFEGFSSKYTSQEDFPLNPGFLDFANTVYRIPGLFEQVRERFEMYPNIKVIKGVLPDVLDVESPERIAFLHIDLNSVKPEIGVFEVLFDRVVSGGIVIFDDYGWLEYVRQKRAEDVFMGERGYSIMELPTGQGLVVKR